MEPDDKFFKRFILIGSMLFEVEWRLVVSLKGREAKEDT